MKICLVTPPSGFLMDERVFITLGILKVGAVLKQAGYEVDHLDFSGVANYEEAAQDYQGNADVFAFTATTPQFRLQHEFVKCLKDGLFWADPTLLSSMPPRKEEMDAQWMRFLDSLMSSEPL